MRRGDSAIHSTSESKVSAATPCDTTARHLPSTRHYSAVVSRSTHNIKPIQCTEQSVSSDTMWHDSSSLAVDATLLSSSEPIYTQHQTNSMHSPPNRAYCSTTLISTKSQMLIEYQNVGIINQQSDRTTRRIRRPSKFAKISWTETRGLPAARVYNILLTTLRSYNWSNS